MDFNLLYEKYHKINLGCNLFKEFKLDKTIFGSGGSNNIILQMTRDDERFIIKIIPDFFYPNQKYEDDSHKLEIAFYQFFTKKYITKDRTPHIVGIYKHRKCDGIKDFLKKLIKGEKCPSMKDKLTRDLEYDPGLDRICDMLLRYEFKLINKDYDIIMLEYCPGQLSGLIRYHIYQISKSEGNKLVNEIDLFKSTMSRVLFQLIFTLAIIKEDYPGFMHGDFFIRNILLKIETGYQSNEYVAYYYKQRIFYLSANGPYAKINDFDRSVIINELVHKPYKEYKNYRKYLNIDPFNQKNDIFNLLYDIYDGANSDADSIINFSRLLKMPMEKIRPLIEFMNKFIDTKTIDKINANNRELMAETWYIDGINLLEKTVKTPDQYLKSNVFKFLQILPENSKVIKHFNRQQY